jgi:coenzyme F420-0:L-glutamate ligase / coenzyme F420-1:gamma-L-glutamate ligase
MDVREIRIIPVKQMGFIEKGQDLTGVILDRLGKDGLSIEDQDVIVITSNVVSKAEGRIVPLSTVTPSQSARSLAKISGRDPRIVELIIRSSKKVCGILQTGVAGVAWFDKHPDTFPVGRKIVEELFQKEPTMILAELQSGFVATDAGIDCSNVEGTENAILLPPDVNESCRRIRGEIRERTGKTVAVIVSDTDIRFQRFGSVDQAIGSWGIETVANHFGEKDLYGKPKIGGVDAIVDMVANSCALVMGNTDLGIPVAIMRGLNYRSVDKGMDCIQVPPNTVGKNVFKNIYYDLKLWLYDLVRV